MKMNSFQRDQTELLSRRETFSDILFKGGKKKKMECDKMKHAISLSRTRRLTSACYYRFLIKFGARLQEAAKLV